MCPALERRIERQVLTHAHTYAHAHVHVQVCVHARAHVHARVRTYTRSDSNSYARARSRSDPDPRIVTAHACSRRSTSRSKHDSEFEVYTYIYVHAYVHSCCPRRAPFIIITCTHALQTCRRRRHETIDSRSLALLAPCRLLKVTAGRHPLLGLLLGLVLVRPLALALAG